MKTNAATGATPEPEYPAQGKITAAELASLALDPIDAWSAQDIGIDVVIRFVTMNREVSTNICNAREAHHISNCILEAAARAQLKAQGNA
jgi:hypothetical protein